MASAGLVRARFTTRAYREVVRVAEQVLHRAQIAGVGVGQRGRGVAQGVPRDARLLLDSPGGTD